MANWISVKDQPPPHDEPVVYARPHDRRPGVWSVGIAYWTVSQKWNPEAESQHAPQGFTHWKPLGDQPRTSGVPAGAPADDARAILAELLAAHEALARANVAFNERLRTEKFVKYAGPSAEAQRVAAAWQAARKAAAGVPASDGGQPG